MSFGEYLMQLRKDRGLSLRETARGLGISASYLSQVEKGRTTPLTPERIQELAEFLQLSEDDKKRLFDLSAEDNNSVPQDCIDYLIDRRYILEALRLSKETRAGEKEWQKMITALLERKKNV